MKAIAMKILALLVCTLALVGGAGASPTSDAQAQIQKAYKLRDAAVAYQNVAFLVSQLAPNYQHVYKGRVYRRTDLARQWETLFSGSQSIKAQSKVLKFSLLGSKARATVRETSEIKGVNASTKKVNRLVMVTLTEDTWSHASGKWQREGAKILALAGRFNNRKISF